MTEPFERLRSALGDRYALERKLGEGGMATVYLAHGVKHDRKVALKVLKPELAAVVGSERFLAEIRTTANLQHPHILPLFDSGEADGFLAAATAIFAVTAAWGWLRDESVAMRQMVLTETLIPMETACRPPVS